MEHLSAIVENQFPSNIRENGQDLIAFVKAYYEWLEQSDVNLGEVSDIDTTLDQFVQEFMATVAPSIPNWAAVDKRLLMKNVHDLWKAKGSEKSIAILFRILFNEEIEVYYPKVDVLRASDGRWVAEKSIRLSEPFVGNIDDLDGELIFGVTSGAGARVEKIISTLERGIRVREVYISGLTGTFVDGEIVRNTTNTISGVVFNVIGPFAGASITKGGAYHQIDDLVDVVQSGGTAATAKVKSVTDRSAVSVSILNGGSGYRVGKTVTEVVGGSGQGATFVVTAVTDPEMLTINTDIIDPMKNVIINTLPTFVSSGANTAIVAASLASSSYTSQLNTALTFDTVETGTISEIAHTSYGYGYSQLPSSANAVDVDIQAAGYVDGVNGGIKGENATFEINRAPGAIVDITVLTQGSSYSKIEDASLVNSRVGTENATVIPNVSGIITYPGKYVDTQGWLSWNNKLQDGYYYQDFSYVIKTSQFVNDFRDVIKKTVHPAGVAMFGELSIRENVSLNPITVTTSPTVEIGQSTTISGYSGTLSSDVTRTWVESHNADLISYAATIQLNNMPFGNNVVTFLEPAFANSSISTVLIDALTFPTYYHQLTESNGYITINTGTNQVIGIGTNFIGLNISSANTHVVLDNIPGDNELKMYKVVGIANNTSMTLENSYSGPTITNGRLLHYTV